MADQPKALRLANENRKLRRIARDYADELASNRNGAHNGPQLDKAEQELEMQAVTFGQWFAMCNRG